MNTKNGYFKQVWLFFCGCLRIFVGFLDTECLGGKRRLYACRFEPVSFQSS